jgi:hypothetical protein
MLCYVTRPCNHEIVMGGWRHVHLWTEKPHYYHWPVDGYQPMKGTDPKATYKDRGWAIGDDSQLWCRVKPLIRQNPLLEENAWKLVIWSCIPKSENVIPENAFEWADTLCPGHKRSDEFHDTNIRTLLYHISGNTDFASNVHYRRFLMEMNLVTTECKIVIPRVHFYDTDESIDTQEITEYYSDRQNYQCLKMDAYKLPF